jgi:hypothetical protein
MRASLVVLVLGITSLAYGTPPPPPEPIQDTFQRFSSEHIPHCERLLHELRNRLSPAAVERQGKLLAALDGYLSNMRGDDVHGFQRALSEPAPSAVPYWSDRIAIDVVGFRRVVDQIIIESFAARDLRSDENFIELLRAFWESERGYAWRFGLEAGPARP